MISFTGVHNYENRDWLMQLPFILINAGGCCVGVPFKLCKMRTQLRARILVLFGYRQLSWSHVKAAPLLHGLG
jgi:hypothetical protein